MLNLMIKIEKIEIIEQEHKAHLAHRSPRSSTGSHRSSRVFQGPPGITQINETNVYQVKDNTSSIPPNDSVATSTALCDTGDFAINGE